MESNLELASNVARTLPRDVIRWLQSLDLTWSVTNPKWDISNGYAVAEVFSWYYPQQIQMHNFANGASYEIKEKNWDVLFKFFKKQEIRLPKNLVRATIHCKAGAAELLLIRLYELLTNRKIQQAEGADTKYEFTDWNYQLTLPLPARSTATSTLNTNIKITELKEQKNVLVNQQKAQELLHKHVQRRIQERVEYPERFGIKPNLAERAVRESPLPHDESERAPEVSELNDLDNARKQPAKSLKSGLYSSSSPVSRLTSQPIEVRQTAKQPGEVKPHVLAAM